MRVYVFVRVRVVVCGYVQADLGKRFDVTGYPTLKIFRNGVASESVQKSGEVTTGVGLYIEFLIPSAYLPSAYPHVHVLRARPS